LSSITATRARRCRTALYHPITPRKSTRLACCIHQQETPTALRVGTVRSYLPSAIRHLPSCISHLASRFIPVSTRNPAPLRLCSPSTAAALSEAHAAALANERAARRRSLRTQAERSCSRRPGNKAQWFRTIARQDDDVRRSNARRRSAHR